MLRRALASGTTWTLANQAIVSVGTFALNILLARVAAPEEYGTFAILFSVMLLLQIANATLLHYPLTIRGAVAQTDARAEILGCGLILAGALSVVLSVALGAVALGMGRADLVGPAIVCFLAWQTQEGLRRCLFAEMRHRDATLGDTIASFGQIGAVAFMMMDGELDLADAFYAMSVTRLLAAMVQFAQIRLSLPSRGRLRDTALDFWTMGKWSLLNSTVAMVRIQIFPWSLAAMHGPAEAAFFQAALNIINLSNPVLIGLCNVIPQTAARSRMKHGYASAWRATRGLLLLGAVPLGIYFFGVIAFPDAMLRVVYGPGSPYLALGLALQLLTLGAIMSYPADIVGSYLLGVDESRLAFIANLAGGGAALALGVPLSLSYGLTGSCAAVAMAGVVRAAVTVQILSKVSSRPVAHVA